MFLQNATAAPLAAHAGLTPLRFLHADPDGRRGRRLARPRGRSLSPHGLELHGNLHTLGYFSADVCLGTPSQKFDLIVDTGSALTALPCAGCSHCGTHRHGTSSSARFAESTSSTGSFLPRDCVST